VAAMPEHTEPNERRFPEPVVHVELRPAHERPFSAIVSLRGEHDLATADEVEQTIRAIDGNVLVDLSDCTFIDSTVIGVLFAANQGLERDGRYLEIVVPPANTNVVRTLELVQMRDVIVVHGVRPSLGSDSAQGA
jgi:anti-anti-sigma factor